MDHFPQVIEAFGGVAFGDGGVWQLRDFAAVALWLPPGVEPGGDATVALFEATVDIRNHAVMQLHPIMYVADQYAERDFYELFGFVRVYEGDEFPGFLAIRHGEAVIGLQQSSADNASYSGGLRWQFELDEPGQVGEIIRACQEHELDHEVIDERGGDRFAHQIVRVVSPSGVPVWFEGTNEAPDAPGR